MSVRVRPCQPNKTDVLGSVVRPAGCNPVASGVLVRFALVLSMTRAKSGRHIHVSAFAALGVRRSPNHIHQHGALAQSGRAPVLQAGGWEFESPGLHQV